MSAALAAPRRCVHCRKNMERFITKSSNQKGNADRPYYKCVPCSYFAGFDDERGNDERNPPCKGCGHPSRRQVAGHNTRVPGGIHYVCSRGTCNFYQPHLNKDGAQLAVVDPELSRGMISLKLV